MTDCDNDKFSRERLEDRHVTGLRLNLLNLSWLRMYCPRATARWSPRTPRGSSRARRRRSPCRGAGRQLTRSSTRWGPRKVGDARSEERHLHDEDVWPIPQVKEYSKTSKWVMRCRCVSIIQQYWVMLMIDCHLIIVGCPVVAETQGFHCRFDYHK